MTTPTDLMTQGKAAALIGVSVPTLKKWILSGQLRSWWVGSWRRVSRADVLDLVRPVKSGEEEAPLGEADVKRAIWLQRQRARMAR